eukprot:1158126-Pelagomonas_calceolata.AAC.6
MVLMIEEKRGWGGLKKAAGRVTPQIPRMFHSGVLVPNECDFLLEKKVKAFPYDNFRPPGKLQQCTISTCAID